MMMIVMGVSPLQYHRHVLFKDKKQTTIVNPKHTWWICPFVFGDEIEKLIFKNRSPYSVSIAYRAQLFPFEGFIIILCVVVIHPSHHSLLSSCLLSLPICYSPKEGRSRPSLTQERPDFILRTLFVESFTSSSLLLSPRESVWFNFPWLLRLFWFYSYLNLLDSRVSLDLFLFRVFRRLLLVHITQMFDQPRDDDELFKSACGEKRLI